MASSDCPKHKSLEQFVIGDLSAADLESVAEHVARCTDCQAVLDSFDALPDELVSGLRRLPVGSATTEGDVPRQLIVAARAACAHGSTATGDSSDQVVDRGRKIAKSLAAGPVRLGRFELLEELGVGSFGHVFRARDSELGRIVAVKVQRAPAHDSPQETDRFLREARSVARLDHANIITLFETGQAEDGTCYLVTEFVEGMTLEQRQREVGYEPKQAAEVVANIADALQYAHDRGVIHRDIKPANILIDSSGRPHIMDFGLAKHDAGDGTMTLDGEVMGTPAYMSPEQARGDTHHVDARSDIYSLGVVLYELLTGERPFQGNRRMLILQVLEDDPRPPRRMNDTVSRDLETICLKAMAKSAARRYASAQEFAEDLRRFLRREPVHARPMPPHERLWTWCRRNPLAAGLIIAVTLGATVGLRHLSRLSLELVHMSAYDSAASHAQLLEEFIAQYSEKIVQRLGDHGVQAVHDYATREGTIPLPATLLTELADNISCSKRGMQVRHYSDYPFLKPGRGGPPDEFAHQALAHLRKHPDEPYVRFEDDVEGRPALRFASARIMKASCVACHNSHPDSTKRDWKVGDVRGVLEIIRPLDRDRERVNAGLRDTFLLVGGILTVLLSFTVVVLVAGNRARRERFARTN